MIKATLKFENGLKIHDQISLLSVQSLSVVYLNNVTMMNIPNMKCPLITVDQSKLYATQLYVENTTSDNNGRN